MSALETLLATYNALNLHSITDYDKFNEYAITHHSTVIEGATLTENETRLLLDEGLTPKGKPLLHSLMVKDHYDALLFVMETAQQQSAITVQLIQDINARVMKHTGNMYYTPLGDVDASKGGFRKGNVSAGGYYFVNYDKVPTYTDALVKKINDNLPTASGLQQQLELSFAAHFDLVTIHPFYDGNGRTSRLLMNYLQALFRVPLAIVFKEDKTDYFNTLQNARKEETLQPFYTFMFNQYTKLLQQEIDVYNNNLKQTKPLKNGGLSLFF